MRTCRNRRNERRNAATLESAVFPPNSKSSSSRVHDGQFVIYDSEQSPRDANTSFFKGRVHRCAVITSSICMEGMSRHRRYVIRDSYLSLAQSHTRQNINASSLRVRHDTVHFLDYPSTFFTPTGQLLGRITYWITAIIVIVRRIAKV